MSVVDDGEWKPLYCTKCKKMLCRVIVAPGMAVESLCRQCGSKDVHTFEGVVEQRAFDELVEAAAHRAVALLRQSGDSTPITAGP